MRDEFQCLNDAHPLPLYKVEALRTLEKQLLSTAKEPDALMMRAAKGALTYLTSRWPDAHKLHIFCGTGHNGGDGYALAYLAQSQGYVVQLWCVSAETYEAGTAMNLVMARCIENSIPCALATPENLSASESPDLFVDALLGIGCRGEVRAPFIKIIEHLNQQASPVLSIDTPSGLDVNTGAVLGVAVRATATVTFLGCKPGFLTGQGLDHTGELVIDNLDVPPETFSHLPASAKLLPKPTAHDWPSRPRDSHKGSFGQVLVVGGMPGMTGAARLAAMAALRMGVGSVRIATDPQHAAAMNLMAPEILCEGIQSPKELQLLLNSARVVILGPGLSTSPAAIALWEVVMSSHLPLIVDADGLNILAKHHRTRGNWVLTPHPGEAARLLHTQTLHVQSDRFAAAEKIQKMYHGVVVLKGAGTVIVDGDAEPAVCIRGNPGMASAGMGDILSGFIAGLLAQGFSLSQAARCGVWLHAMAGDEEAKNFGELGLLPSDMLNTVRRLQHTIRGF